MDIISIDKTDFLNVLLFFKIFNFFFVLSFSNVRRFKTGQTYISHLSAVVVVVAVVVAEAVVVVVAAVASSMTSSKIKISSRAFQSKSKLLLN
jgi:hypothetical protein